MRYSPEDGEAERFNFRDSGLAASEFEFRHGDAPG